ncbi:hypothetical protein, partial [Enterococcus faecalis]|uniref:hypothetical protein n=1 Tax=Enterococcus faecalis TaxID=1351 RepID=UPI00398470EF
PRAMSCGPNPFSFATFERDQFLCFALIHHNFPYTFEQLTYYQKSNTPDGDTSMPPRHLSAARWAGTLALGAGALLGLPGPA